MVKPETEAQAEAAHPELEKDYCVLVFRNGVGCVVSSNVTPGVANTKADQMFVQG